MPDEYGPFETERQASDSPAARAAYAAFDAGPGPGKMLPHNYAMLTRACEAAGVELGEYDARALHWLANWEPGTCAAVAGIIRRAAARPGAVTEWGVRLEGSAGAFASRPGEDEAREVAARYPRARTEVVRREVTPWRPAGDPATGEGQARDA